MNSISFELDKNGLAILKFDDPENSVNKLSAMDIDWMLEFLGNIEKQLDMIENEEEIRAVVLYSNKKNSFLNGGDIVEYLNFMLADEGRVYSLKAQELTERRESSRAPFVAAVAGPCLGMGLEIALACAYRIASDNPETYFGMNGVEAGLIPCAGGTQRLPRLIGTKEALDLILFGESLSSNDAELIGLVDEVAPDEILLEIALERALQISQKELKPRRGHFKGIGHTIVNENPIARKKLFTDVRKKANKSRHPSVNAPIMAIEALEVGMSSFNRGLHVESVYFGELVVSTASRSLIRSRIALEKVKEQSGVSSPGAEPDYNVKKVAVIGASNLAMELISLISDHGFRVRFRGNTDQDVCSGLRYCYDYFKEKYDDQEINGLEFEQKFDLISGATDYSGIKRSQIIIECIEEDLKQKLGALKEVDTLSGDNSIYLSSSFVFPVAGIASNSAYPKRVIGARFFSPADHSELAEISITENTSTQELVRVMDFMKKLGKIPVVVNGATGSYTTRVQLSYFNESLNLVSEGVSIENIEEAMLRLGFDEGPFQTIDKIGIDSVLKASNIIFEIRGDKIKPHPSLGLLVSNDRLGYKNGQGFYNYHKGHGRLDKTVYKFFPIHSEKSGGMSDKQIQERLLLAMVNEALVCLDEGVINSPQEGDIAAILGLGFPAVIGGPFNYVDSEGAGDVLKKLHNLSTKYGTRYISPVLLKDTSVSGKKFYDS